MCISHDYYNSMHHLYRATDRIRIHSMSTRQTILTQARAYHFSSFTDFRIAFFLLSVRFSPFLIEKIYCCLHYERAHDRFTLLENYK